MIAKKLRKRAQDRNPIRVGWVGAGRMMSGAICRDLRLEAAIRAYELNGIKRSDYRGCGDGWCRPTGKAGRRCLYRVQWR